MDMAILVQDTEYVGVPLSGRITQLERIANAIKRTCGPPHRSCRLKISVRLANKFDFERIVLD